jgi:hypothetical protein
MGNLSLTPTGLVIFLLYIILSVKASTYDIKYRLVKNETYISLIFLSVSNIIRMIVETEEIDWFICFIRFLTYSMLIMSVAVVIIIFVIVTNAMGGGDVKYIFCSMLFLVPEREVSVLILWFLIMFTLMLIYGIVIQYTKPDKRKNGIPMIPFISGAGIIMVIISDFILKL